MSLRTSLEAAGLTVRTVNGWGTRGGSWAAGKPVGVMQHHTAPPVPFPVNALWGDRLKCNINIKPDGTVWLIAQRACNYSSGSGSSVVLDEVRAGTPPTKNASDRGLWDDTNGNPWFFNFENDHAGDGGPMPAVQHDAIVRATRVVLDHYGLDAGNVISHAEWTARKTDPYWNGSRRAIEEIRAQLEENPVSLPISAQSGKEEIRHVQEMLGQPASGDWDFKPAVKDLAARSHTGDPKGKDGTHINGRMYTQLLEEFIAAKAPQGAPTSHDHDGRYVRDVTVAR